MIFLDKHIRKKPNYTMRLWGDFIDHTKSFHKTVSMSIEEKILRPSTQVHVLWFYSIIKEVWEKALVAKYRDCLYRLPKKQKMDGIFYTNRDDNLCLFMFLWSLLWSGLKLIYYPNYTCHALCNSLCTCIYLVIFSSDKPGSRKSMNYDINIWNNFR